MQNSPSGSGLITDFIPIAAAFQINSGTAAGKYYVISGILGLVAGLIPVVPGAEFLAIPNGVQTRQGRLVRTRLLSSGTDLAFGKRKPTILQWLVIDHVTGDINPAGDPVEIPWGPNNTTLVTLNDFVNTPINFGSVKWNAGDLYLLQVTVGTVISGAPGLMQLFLSSEAAYVALSPVAGPLGSP
jgi:hypothetical protein